MSIPRAPAASTAVSGSPPPAPQPTTLPSPAGASLHNLVVSDDGAVRVSVVLYDDCTGQTRMTYSSAYLDTCWAVPYFGAHDVPWLFQPLLRMPPGASLTYYDGSGGPHRYRLVAFHDVAVVNGRAYLPHPAIGTAAQFGTCLNAGGTMMRIFEAQAA